MKNKLIRLLGGVTAAQHEELRERIESKVNHLIAEKNAYKTFAEATYIYAGNYPAWKAQSEYRQIMSEKGSALKELSCGSKNELVDSYLGRIVDSYASLFATIKPDFMNAYHWKKDRLEEARGGDYLRS